MAALRSATSALSIASLNAPALALIFLEIGSTCRLKMTASLDANPALGVAFSNSWPSDVINSPISAPSRATSSQAAAKHSCASIRPGSSPSLLSSSSPSPLYGGAEPESPLAAAPLPFSSSATSLPAVSNSASRTASSSRAQAVLIAALKAGDCVPFIKASSRSTAWWSAAYAAISSDSPSRRSGGIPYGPRVSEV